MDPDGAIAGAPPPSGPAPIIGAEDEEFENDIEPPPPLSAAPFCSLEQLRQRPAHLAAFLLHCLLQFEPGPALCWLHAQLLLRRPHPKEGRKNFQEFGARFLERSAPLRVPVPPHVQQELERTRPELLAEEAQRRCLRELQAWQEPEVTRQLEDFRAKRLMGMTPGEAELAELDALPTRDPARERQLAETLLSRLEDMHASISPDEEKSAAAVAAVCAYLRLLGVKAKGGADAKKPKGHFFRKKLPGGRKAEEAKSKRGFSLAGAALWGRDGSDGRQNKTPENEGEREKAEGGVGGGRPPKNGDPPPGTAASAAITAEGNAGSDPPGDAAPPPEPPHNEQRNDEGGGDGDRKRISPEPFGPGGDEAPPRLLHRQRIGQHLPQPGGPPGCARGVPGEPEEAP